ncbi:hypothetical protein DKX38_029748 [Salix brachista]|uniref:O-methyltransferase domain-containing protein n=1 Tax=Salix brachista TaxID=2182728 RepID=A0A5N5J3G6_9ROSI|nr:hypothetical protein DKX38_029748 [Salix brachista]
MELINEEGANELLQAQTRVWNHALEFINSMALKCAVELEIPDAIQSHGKPITLSELASSLPIHPSKGEYLYRLMRILVHSGIFSLKKVGDDPQQEGYSLTPTSRFLLKGNPLSVRPLLLFWLDPVPMEALQCLSTWFQNEDLTAFNTAHGKCAWELTGKNARLNNVFNEAMASDGALTSGVVMNKCKGVFEGLKSLVDVGGGTGAMAKCIAETFPTMNCIVFDLPHVVSGLQGSDNLKFVGGDMFESVPSADAILLKWILHDWSDEECVKILKQCKEALGRNGKIGGKVIIIDMILGNQNWDEKSTETQLFFDLFIMTCVSGRERSEKELANLFFAAGFSNYKINPVLGVRGLIEVYP